MRSWLLAAAASGARRLPLVARLALYRLGPVTHLLRGVLTRAAPPGVMPVQVAAGPLAGQWLMLDLRVDKDLWLGTYEPEMSAAIARFAVPAEVAYDLGANVGQTSLLLARAVGPQGRVFAFEPLPENLERLRRAVSLNRLEGRIEVVAAAVGERPGREPFLVHPSGGMGRLGGGHGRRDGFISQTEVEVVTLDGFVAAGGHPPPSLIKVDLEGGEAAAVRGMARVLREHRPTLLVELHGGDAAEAVVAQLAEAGYELLRMQPGYPVLRSGELAAYVVALPPKGEA